MRTFTGLILFLFLTHFAHGQSVAVYKHFTGTINNHDISLDLCIYGKHVSGTYSFNDGSEYLILEGEEESPNQFALNVTNVYLETVGLLNGTLAEDVFSGQWQSIDGADLFDLSATESYNQATAFTGYGVKKELKGSNNAVVDLDLFFFEPTEQKSMALTRWLTTAFFGSDFNVGASPNNLKLLEDSFVAQFEAEAIDNQSGAGWGLSQSTQIIFNEQDVVSVMIEKWEYYGGAHGIGSNEYAVFDMLADKQIRLLDVLSEPHDKLSELISTEIREKYGLSDSEKLTDVGFNADTVEPSNNFYLNKVGIGFFYNPYEIGTYALGPTEVFIPYSQIEDLLIEGSLAAKLYAH